MSRVIRLGGNEGQGVRIIPEGADRKVTVRPAYGEEIISVPIPYGDDFLNVRIGQVIPREDETTFQVDHNDYLSVKILRKLGFGRHASVWLGHSDQWKCVYLFSNSNSTAHCFRDINKEREREPVFRSQGLFDSGLR